MKGRLIVLRPRSRSCAFCGFGPNDGEHARAIFKAADHGRLSAWACAKHLKYVSGRLVGRQEQTLIDRLADGSIQ